MSQSFCPAAAGHKLHYGWKSAETGRQDTPLFLTGSRRKVNLASLNRAFFFRCGGGRGRRPSSHAACRACGISRRAGFFPLSGAPAGKGGKQVFQLRQMCIRDRMAASFPKLREKEMNFTSGECSASFLTISKVWSVEPVSYTHLPRTPAEYRAESRETGTASGKEEADGVD